MFLTTLLLALLLAISAGVLLWACVALAVMTDHRNAELCLDWLRNESENAGGMHD